MSMLRATFVTLVMFCNLIVAFAQDELDSQRWRVVEEPVDQFVDLLYDHWDKLLSGVSSSVITTRRTFREGQETEIVELVNIGDVKSGSYHGLMKGEARVRGTNPKYSFVVTGARDRRRLGSLVKVDRPTRPTSYRHSFVDPMKEDATDSTVRAYYTFALPGLRLGGHFVALPILLNRPGVVVERVERNIDSGDVRLMIRHSVPLTNGDPSTNVREASVTLRPSFGYQIVQNEVLGEYSNGFARRSAVFEYTDQAGQIVASRVAESVSAGLKTLDPPTVTFVIETEWEPFESIPDGERIFYLSHYGIPEPSFAESGSRFRIGMLLIGVTMLVGGYLLVRNRRSQTG